MTGIGSKERTITVIEAVSGTTPMSTEACVESFAAKSHGSWKVVQSLITAMSKIHFRSEVGKYFMISDLLSLVVVMVTVPPKGSHCMRSRLFSSGVVMLMVGSIHWA